MASTTTTTPVRRREQLGGYAYPGHAGLLDRKALVLENRRLERRLLKSTAQLDAESRKASELDAESRRMTKVSTRERRTALRLEKAIFSSYARLLAAVDAYDDEKPFKDDDDDDKSQPPSAEQRLRDALRVEELKFKTTLPSSQVTEDIALSRAFAETGAELASRVEAALDDARKLRDDAKAAKATLESERAERKDDLDRDVRITGLEEKVRDLEDQVKRANERNAELEAEKLDAQRAGSSNLLKERRASILASIDTRDFKHSVLDLLADLSSAVHRRLGFIPASTRRNINTFISILAENYDAKDLFFAPPDLHNAAAKG